MLDSVSSEYGNAKADPKVCVNVINAVIIHTVFKVQRVPNGLRFHFYLTGVRVSSRIILLFLFISPCVWAGNPSLTKNIYIEKKGHNCNQLHHINTARTRIIWSVHMWPARGSGTSYVFATWTYYTARSTNKYICKYLLIVLSATSHAFACVLNLLTVSTHDTWPVLLECVLPTDALHCVYMRL